LNDDSRKLLFSAAGKIEKTKKEREKSKKNGLRIIE